MKSRSGQSATEFVVLISFMFFVFFLFFFAIQNRIVDANSALEHQSLVEIDSLARSYIVLASQSFPDFSKSFVLPNIDNFDYSIIVEDNNTLVVSAKGSEYVDFLPLVVKGRFNLDSGRVNIVYHQDGRFLDSSNKIISDSNAEGVFLNVDAERCAFLNYNSSCSSSSIYSDCVLIGVCS